MRFVHNFKSEDYNRFKKIMVQRNIQLETEAMNQYLQEKKQNPKASEKNDMDELEKAIQLSLSLRSFLSRIGNR